MNNITYESVAQANEEIYEKLLVSIEAGVGMLQIFIAVCDTDRQREAIITRYERDLAPSINTYRVFLDPEEPTLRLAVSQQITDTKRENAVAMVMGTQTLGLRKNDESLNKFFGYLQWTREGLRELKMPIVLWIPSRILVQLAKKAPDFYSWRNGVFQFQPEPYEETVEPLTTQSIEFEGNKSSSIFDVEQLESSLAKALAMWGENSSNLEPLYSQLGNLYADRVQSGESPDREREFILAQDYLNKAIALQTQFKQEDALAHTLSTLALLYRSQGRYTEAEPLFLQALELSKHILGNNHLDVATSLNNLALLYDSQGRYSEAELLHKKH